MIGKSWAVALTASLMVGCGYEADLVPVSGTVTHDGAPLEEATVVFIPVGAKDEGQATATVSGSGGVYRVSTNGSPGLVPGKYRVRVSKLLNPPPKMTKEEAEQFGEDDPYMAIMVRKSDPKNRRLAMTSKAPDKIAGEFPAEVGASGGVLDFDVKPKPRERSPREKTAPPKRRR
jgi:hypothetical protein